MTGEELSWMRQELKEGVQRAKNGENVQQLFDRLSAMHKDGSLPKLLLWDFGWFVYYKLKHTPLSSVLPRKRHLLLSLRLRLPRPSLLHSLILAEAVKLKKSSPAQFRLGDFVSLWGLENLREEDWEKFKPDHGHSPNSLVENLIGAYTKEIIKDRTPAPEDFGALVDKAIEFYPTNPHLPLYRPVVLASRGKNGEALECYRGLLRRWPRKFFLWSKAERLLPYTEADTRIALLCKALTLVRNEGFLGDIRLRLANLLMRKGMQANAQYELERYRQFYISQRWHMRNWHETLSRRLDATAPGVAPSPTPYSSFLPLADRFTVPHQQQN